MRKYLWVIIVCVVAAGAWAMFHSGGDEAGGDQTKGAGSSSGGGKHGGNAKGATVQVNVATAKNGDMAVYLNGLGNITPRSTAIVHSLITGQLMQIFFQEGQTVKKDDMLAKIDDRPYVAQLEQMQGLLARDQALLSDARVNLERYKELWAKDSIAKQQLDTQISLVKQYEGAVKNDQGQVDNAKVNVDYTNIIAPVAGRVGLRQVDVGNIVHTTDTNGIVIVAELQPITALFTIPEDNIPAIMKHVNAGEKLEAEAWDRDNKNKLATGTLTAIDNQVDQTTGTVKFRAEFVNEDNSLFPSQFVNIRLKLDTLKNAVVIPTAAVQRGTKGTFVYVAKPDKTVSMQTITLGPSEGENVSVTQGVTAGDQLVVDGVDSLRDGAKIDITSTDDSAKNGHASTNAPGTADGDKGEGKSDDKKDGEKAHHHHKKHGDDAQGQ